MRRTNRSWWAVLTVIVLSAQSAHAAPAILRDASDGPQWARTQAFPTTRAYVVPASTLLAFFDINAVIGTTDADYVRENARYAMWLGLGYHLVLEASLQVTAFQSAGTLTVNQQAMNIRWALADWGQIVTNPTLAIGVAFNNAAAPTAGLQLNLADGWSHGPWAIDASFARELHGTALTQTYGFTAAMAYAWEHVPVDLGVELFARLSAGETGENGGLAFEVTEGLFLGGPYVRWAPVSEASILFNVAAGTQVKWVNEVASRIPVIQPKLTLAWSL